MTKRRVPLAGALAFALSASTLARGADPVTMQEANARFQEGAALMDRGDCEHARVKFLAVVALVKSSTALWNLGYCEARSGHEVEGVRHLRQYLRNPAAEPKNVAFANAELLPKALAVVGQIQIDAPAGVALVVDGKDEVGDAPLVDPVAIAPGSHRVTARLGAQTLEQDVDVVAGQTAMVRLAPPVVATAAEVPSPPRNDEPVAATRDTAATPTSSAWTPGRRVALGLGVAAVVVEAVGIGFGVSAHDNDANAAAQRGDSSSCFQSTSGACAALQRESSDARTDALVANVLYASGGALAVAAIATWFLAPPRRTADAHVRWRVLPALGDRGGRAVSLGLGADF